MRGRARQASQARRQAAWAFLGLVMVSEPRGGLPRPRGGLPVQLSGSGLDWPAAIAPPRFVPRGSASAGPGTGNGRAQAARCRRGALARIGAGGGGGAWPTARDRVARHPVDRRGDPRRARARRAGGWRKTGTYVRDPRVGVGRNGRPLAGPSEPQRARRGGLHDPPRGGPRAAPGPRLGKRRTLSAGGSDASVRTGRARRRRAA